MNQSLIYSETHENLVENLNKICINRLSIMLGRTTLNMIPISITHRMYQNII